MKKKNMMMDVRFHPVVWGLIIGTFISRVGFYMTIPFLAIYLHSVKGIDPAMVGAILAISFIVGTFSSFFGGALSDSQGRFPIMIMAMAAWVIVFIGFAFADQVWLFFLLSALNGMCRNVFEPTARALLADITPSENRIAVFNARYFAINIGGAIGPLIGLRLGEDGTALTLPCLLTAGILTVYCLTIVGFMVTYKDDRKKSVEKAKHKLAFNVILRDKVFGCFLLGNVFIAAAYAHLDTTLPQFMGSERADQFAFLIFMNALFVLLFQYPLAKLMKRFTSLTALKLGCILFGIGLFGFGVFDSILLLTVSVMLFTVGEILCFVVGDVVIGEIAPEHLRGAYYGASGLMFIGQGFGAWIGGYLLKLLGLGGGTIAFGVLMLLAFIAYPFFHQGKLLLEQKEARLTESGIAPV